MREVFLLFFLGNERGFLAIQDKAIFYLGLSFIYIRTYYLLKIKNKKIRTYCSRIVILRGGEGVVLLLSYVMPFYVHALNSGHFVTSGTARVWPCVGSVYTFHIHFIMQMSLGWIWTPTFFFWHPYLLRRVEYTFI